MRTFIKGTRRFSEGRRALARAMGVMQIRRNPENSDYTPRASDVLVNWGQYGEDYGMTPTWINKPSAVRVATNKLSTFAMLNEANVPTVIWTGVRSTARRWTHQIGPIMHRATARGSQGAGITIVRDVMSFPEGGFFCQLFGDDQNKEYRVHVVDGVVIDFAQKRIRSRRNGYTGRFDSTVRSSANGWVFCREGVECPDSVKSASVEAVAALGLDFGAVDCAISEAGAVCVYEVNTAPGLEGTTLERYAAALTAATANSG